MPQGLASGKPGLARVGKPVISRIHGDLSTLVRQPRIQERFSAQGLEVRATSPQDFSQYLANEVKRWQQVVNAAGIEKQ